MLSVQNPTNVFSAPEDKSTVAEVNSKPQTIDELIRFRAAKNPTQPIVSYPSSGIDYEDYTMQQLDVFASRAAQSLSSSLLPQRLNSATKPSVIGLLGPSDIDYLITTLAITKLGHTVLFLSTRISKEAYTSLLEATGSQHLIIHESFTPLATEIQADFPSLQIDAIVPACTYKSSATPISTIEMRPRLDSRVEAKNIAWIIHSSGSTGLPKPIYQTHQAAITNYANNMNMRGFITLPLYHAHGISSLFRAIFSGKQIHLYNASLALTKDFLVQIMTRHNFEIFYGVPYALKLLAESDDGILPLANCKVVMFGGSACPDSLGNKLVARGVNLVSHYGTTETGQLMTSFRPEGDNNWDYVRPSEDLRPFLRFEERGPGLFELICLNGWPSKVASNRPDGSYATKDLFQKHPTIEGYKYFARLDDTLVLVNGEKVNPLIMEGMVREHPWVAEAVVAGSGKTHCAVMIIPASTAEDRSDDEICDKVWPTIEKINNSAPAYASISREMVQVIRVGTDYPKTDKGTVIRAAFYKKFSTQIENPYEEKVASNDTRLLSDIDLLKLVKKEALDVVNIDAASLTDDIDFFAIGMDSLQATRLRTSLVKQVNTQGHRLGLNVVFDFPSLTRLTKHLSDLQLGTTAETKSVKTEMEELIQKYGTFKQHVLISKQAASRVIVLTGATGSLGAHIAAKLSARADVSKIYCLARAKSIEDAQARVAASLKERQLLDVMTQEQQLKLVVLPSKFSAQHLGLNSELYEEIVSAVTDVIHCAWSVNFRLQLSSFEQDCILGTRNLMNLALEAKQATPASFNFCSSVSTVANTPGTEISEALPLDLSYAQEMGYAQSKLVMENLIIRAAKQTNLQARVLRIGQIIGDTQHGIWNGSEAIPLMLQSATTIGALPCLDENPHWLPVDVVGDAVIESSLSSAAPGVYNIVNQLSFHWTRDLLPLLHQAGLVFEEVTQQEWVQRLRVSNHDPVANPPIKLVDFFASKYDNSKPRKSAQWRTDKARAVSSSLEASEVVNLDIVTKMVDFFIKRCWTTSKEYSA